MQIIKCFEVMGNTDTTEGRGPMKLAARFSTYDAAVSYVKSPAYARYCVMGLSNWEYDRLNIKESTIIILDRVDELEQMHTEELRASAMKKLSKEEILALGL